MNTVIYYPELPSPEWLKLASLCWDRVFLLPYRIDHELNIYTMPKPPDVVHLCRTESVRKTWSVLGNLVEVMEVPTKGRMQSVPAPLEEQLKDITKHWMTLKFESMGLEQRELTDESVRTITLLTNQMAADTAITLRRDLATDIDFFAKALVESDSSFGSDVATRVLQAYFPANLSNLDPERIRDCRNQLSEKRLAYQQAIQSLCDDYAKVASEGELGRLRSRAVDLAKERIQHTQAAYRNAKIELVVGSFGLSLAPPALASVLASALSTGIWLPGAVASAVSLFASKALLGRAKSKREYDASPWSYVLDIRKIT